MRKTQTLKWIYASSAGVLVLAIFLGWRGSNVILANHSAQLQKRVHSEAHLAQELSGARITEFDTEAFNVISAEYLQHNSRAPNASAELNDSPFGAVGVLELKTTGYEPLWWSVSPKFKDALNADFLRGLVPDWQESIKQMGRHYFIRAGRSEAGRVDDCAQPNSIAGQPNAGRRRHGAATFGVEATRESAW